jgi:hypothetical protein
MMSLIATLTLIVSEIFSPHMTRSSNKVFTLNILLRSGWFFGKI